MTLEEFKEKLESLFLYDDIDVKIKGNYHTVCIYPEPMADNYPIVAQIHTHIVGDYLCSPETLVLKYRTDMVLVEYLVKAFANTAIGER